MRLVESIAGTFSVQDGPPVSSIQREFIKGYRQLFGFGTILARSPLEGHGQHFIGIFLAFAICFLLRREHM